MKKEIRAVGATSDSRKFALLATCRGGLLAVVSNLAHAQVANPIATPHKPPVSFMRR
jgi:hypothetical protein